MHFLRFNKTGNPKIRDALEEKSKDSKNYHFLDELADALVKVGKARRAMKKEGYALLKKGLEKGCPHVVTVVSGRPLELCNTCSECCVLWKREKLGIECIKK